MINLRFIGIDLGYNRFKYYSEEGYGSIRSAVATDYQGSPEIILGDNEDIYGDIEAIYLDGEFVAVGEQALGWSNRLDNIRRDYHRSPAALALLRASLLQATRKTGTRPVTAHLTLALPAANFNAQQEALNKWLEGQGNIWRIKFIDNSGRAREKTFSIASIETIMQPQAALLGLWMTDKGLVRNKEQALARTIVVDVGAGTADIGLFKKFRPQGELASPSGGWQIISNVEKAVKTLLSEYDPDRFDLDKIVQGDGQIFYRGQSIDASEIIDKALDKAARSLSNHILGTIPNAQNIRNVLVVGGWGERLFSYIKRHFPHAVLVSDLADKNGDWTNELPSDMPHIGLAAKGCFARMMYQEARKKKKKQQSS